MENGGGDLEAKIEMLLNVEKQMRQVGDVAVFSFSVWIVMNNHLDPHYRAEMSIFIFEAWSLSRLAIITPNGGDYNQDGPTTIRIVAVQAMVQQAMQYIDQTPDLDTKIELIKTLNSVSAGKIYVEIERARLIKKLAKIKEEQGLIAEAADLMQEVAVETFGAMAKTEKISFILEQVHDFSILSIYS
ncbi:26S proteasome non-ATPase regulatory subunitA [Sesamum angolense]|uniref:26S proteasome non-ATPase regulatory subunitA n=1 Tax=Sesamum angolense TaxID=2727404 RepID=A0AAE1VZQ7_9LAMI|nr:26S proteasome non-ATPase regulatory subunitA [Sesamum angolense]